MFFFNLFRGADVVGNWLRIMFQRWIQIAVLGSTTDQANLTAALNAVAGVAALLIKRDSLENAANWKVIAATSSISALASFLIGYLLELSQLGWYVITVISMFVSFTSNLSAPHLDRYRVEIAGKKQKKLAYAEEATTMSARMIAGVVVALFMYHLVNHDEVLFYVDALSFVPFLIYVCVVTPKHKPDKDPKRTVLGPKESYQILKEYPRLHLLLFVMLVVSSFGNFFSYVPEILLLEFKATSFGYGGWLGLTGGAGAIGALIGKYIAERWGFSTKATFCLFLGGAISGVACGLSKDIYTFTGAYMMYCLFQCMASPWIDGLARLVHEDHFGSISRLRGLVAWPLGQIAIYFFSLAIRLIGLSPIMALLISACIYLMLLVVIYATWGRKEKPVL